MNLLLEQDICDYCDGEEAERLTHFTGALASQLRPYFVIPVFELCRAVYFGSLERGLELDRFHTCWESLLVEHVEHMDDGYVVRLLSGAESWNDVYNAFFDHSDMTETFPEHDRGDPRDRQLRHAPLTGRMRRSSLLLQRFLKEQDPRARAWSGSTLESLNCRIEQSHGHDLVLDSNNALDLLCCLRNGGMSRSRPSYLKRISVRTKRWFEEIAESRGAAGKLIIPISALEESCRVAARKGDTYKDAYEVMRDLRYEPERWAHILQPDPLTPEIFGAFVQLLNTLASNKIPPQQWPHFGDALVLAHGLAHGCPVASSEWDEKNDWASIGSLFPWLRPEYSA